MPITLNQTEDSSKGFVVWLVALILAALGAQLWTVWLYGSPVPIWDQWDEATSIFKPWLAGHLTWGEMISPNNNHRILLTRLLDLTLIYLNGRWDPLLQMTVNAFVRAIFVGVLALCLWDFWRRKNGWLVCFLVMPFFILPYAGENAIWGMDSQWYFLNLFGLAAVAGLGFAKPGTGRWALGLVAAVLGLFSMATGLLAPVTAGGVILLRAFKHRRMEKKNLAGLGVCFLLAGAGASLVAAPRSNGLLQAQSFGDFTKSLAQNLAWPFPNTTIMACVIALPLVLLLVLYLRPDFREATMAELVLALALWSAMQSVAIAFGRANSGLYVAPASRYMDVCNIFVIASVFAAVLTGQVWERKWFPAWNGLLLPMIFACVIIFGLCRISQRVVEDVLIVTREWNLIAQERAQTYLATGNPKELFDPPTIQPDPRLALRVLGDPTLRTILPAACFPPAAAPEPGRLSGAAQWLLKHSIAIFSIGLILFVAVCGYGLTRGKAGLKVKMPAGIFALLAGFLALGFVWSNRSLQRKAVEYDLQQQITDYFKAKNRPDRAAIHEQKAEELKPH